MSGGQVKKLNASIFFLDKDKLFGNRTSKNFDRLARGTSENFLIFLPLKIKKLLIKIASAQEIYRFIIIKKCTSSIRLKS